MNNARHVVKRHWRLVAVTLSAIFAFWILYVLRSTLFPFVLGLVLAYVFMPAILWIERRLPGQDRWQRTKRVLAIVVIFVVILGLVVLFFFYFLSAFVSAFSVLPSNISQYISEALLRLQQWLEFLRRQLPPDMQQELDRLVQEAGVALGNAVQGILERGVSLIPATISFVFGLAVLPVFLFYVLRDWERLSRSFYSIFPSSVANHAQNIVSIVEGVLGRYIRAQLVLSLSVGLLAFVGLLSLRVPLAPALAVVAAVSELVPTVGPWIGGAVAVIVTLAVAPGKAIWVAGLFLVVQLLENVFLVPRIHGGFLRIHPAIVIVLLVMGAHFAGLWGTILAVPVAATVVEIYRYVHRAVRVEDISTTPQP